MYRLFVLLFCLAVIDGRYFRNDYTFHPEIGGWMKLHRVPANWNEARLRCQLEGAILLSPLNDSVTNAMKTIICQFKLRGVFTGISATYSKGDFYSVEGIPLDKIPVTWAPEEPDNCDDKEQCLVLLPNGTMADDDCHSTYPYICYKKNSEDIPTPLNCGTVDPEYIYSDVTSHCYKFHFVGEVWSRAFKTCSAEGGHLAIINGVKEAQVLKELFAKFPPNLIMAQIKDIANIGFRAETNTNNWLTVHGETLKQAGYEIWANGQPDNWTIQSCGAIFRDAKLDDSWCHKHTPFICEKTPGSLLDNDTGTTDEIAAY